MAAIPPDLEPLVIAEAGKGLTTRQIAAWLKDRHGVETSHKSVAKVLARTRSERSEVAKVVLREKLGGSLTTDIDRLEKHASKLDTLADSAAEIKEFDSYARLVEQLRKITDTKLHYSGAGEADEDKGSRKPVIFIPPESDD